MSQVSVEHIEINQAGEAKLVGSRIKVKHLAAVKQTHGYSAEQIQQEVYPHLNLAQIHAALAYYYDHQREIDDSLSSDDATHEHAWQKQQSDPEHRELISKMKNRDAHP
jgi:uncharacterized protein (DUF433 family)